MFFFIPDGLAVGCVEKGNNQCKKIANVTKDFKATKNVPIDIKKNEAQISPQEGNLHVLPNHNSMISFSVSVSIT